MGSTCNSDGGWFNEQVASNSYFLGTYSNQPELYIYYLGQMYLFVPGLANSYVIYEEAWYSTMGDFVRLYNPAFVRETRGSVVLVPSFLGLLVLSLINTHNFVVA